MSEQSTTYDADGKVTAVQEASGGSVTSPASYAYGYYADGQRAGLSVSSSGLSQGNMLQYAYRMDGLRSKLAFTDGAQTASWSWTRTNAGRVTSLADSSGQSAHTTTYDAQGRVSGDAVPSGAMTGLQYDDEGELTGFTWPGANDTSTITYTIRGELASQVYSTIDTCGTEGDTAPPLYQKSANGYMVSYVPSSCPGGGPIISWDARTGVGLGNSSNENSSVSYAFDAAGRQTSGTQAWSYTHQCGDQQCEVDGNGTQTRTFDAQNHLLTETTTNWDTPSAGLNGCLTGSIVPHNIGGDVSTLAWGPNGHPDLWDSMTLHWDGNTPLFVTDSSGAIKEIKIEGLGYYAPAATHPMTFLDRDPAGFVVAAHWSGGHSDWQPSNPYHQVCNTQALSGYVFLEPGSDGISDGENTIQGVRNFDPALATWTSPDAYAGDASDPMSRKSFMWDENNSYAYSDPSGYYTICQYGGDPSLGAGGCNPPPSPHPSEDLPIIAHVIAICHGCLKPGEKVNDQGGTCVGSPGPPIAPRAAGRGLGSRISSRPKEW